jgi:ribosome maturation factor RimP
MSSVSDSVAQLMSDVGAGFGVDVEDAQLIKQGRITVLDVTIDRDGGVDLDFLAEISSEFSRVLDENPVGNELPEGYVLQVGSPGIERPLTLERHWRRAARRLVEVHPKQAAMFTDRIVAVVDGAVQFAQHEPINVEDIDHGIVQVEFTPQEA